jgi:class 3 adenylate cyclase
VPEIDDAHSDPKWLQVLTKGHSQVALMRPLWKLLPGAPRCKECYLPFGAPGSTVGRLFGFRRSRKNPNLCHRCCERLPEGGALIDIAVLFADVRGSTTMGAKMNPAQYAGLMNRFYKTATNVLAAHDAIIDKLIGDEVMALFFLGTAGPDYRRKAVDAGEALLRAVRDKDSARAWLELGVAVHAGEAYVGNVGGDGVSDFTALGDTVNTAARLQSLAGPGQLVISDQLYEQVAGRYPEAERIESPVRGKDEPVPIRILTPGL